MIVKELTERETAIQIWSNEDPTGISLQPVVYRIIALIRDNPELGIVLGTEGPTAHIPDYFSDLYGTMMGFLVYVSDGDPITLKKLMMQLEEDESGRLMDIDVYTDYFTKISRKQLPT